MGKNFSTYETNLSLFMERFPKLALFAPSWISIEVEKETLSHLNLEKVEVLYFLGLGTGAIYFQVQKWLKEKPERTLVILEKNEGVIASFLHQKNAEEILSDPQVQIELLNQRKQIDQLAERFPVKGIEVVGLKSDSILRNLRLKLFRKTTLSHALYTDRLHGYQPFQNFVQNLRHLPSSFYANKMKGAFANIPAIVCGAGPSLQKSIEVLRTLEKKALLIAGGSTLAALSSKGIAPHFGMAIDPNLEEYRRLRNSFAFEVPFLYSTRVCPTVFQTCNGPFGYMRSGIGGLPELWIEEELGLSDLLLGDFLSPESISVTAICVAWAQYLGCNPILLSGVDLAYTGKKRYASGVDDDEEIPFAAIDAEKSAPDRILKRKDRLGQPIYTAVRWIMESASLSHFAKKHPEVQFINTTEGGLGFKHIPYRPFSEITFSDEWDLRALVHQKIAESPIPSHAKECIETKMGELKKSLERVIQHLQILSGKEKGSKALAEMELKEEMAYDYLFYDIQQILNPSQKPDFPWEKFLRLSLQYQALLPVEIFNS